MVRWLQNIILHIILAYHLRKNILVWQGTSSVQYCMCDTDNCNSGHDLINSGLEPSLRLPRQTNLSMRSLDFQFPFDNSSSAAVAFGSSGVGGVLGTVLLGSGAGNGTQSSSGDDLIAAGGRQGRQRRLQCYQCGSLFNRDAPDCDKFDPRDPGQLTTCNEGEACMLYTWRKSKTEIGKEK